MNTLSQFAINCNNKLKLFLDRWNLGNISELTLEQYSQVGNNDTFSYWLEYGSEELGRITGQTSSTKYGIWNRNDDSEGGSKLLGISLKVCSDSHSKLYTPFFTIWS